MRLRIVLLVLGLLLAVTGVALLSIPLALIVAGAAVVAIALLWPYPERGERR